jgi:hypothetical protein
MLKNEDIIDYLVDNSMYNNKSSSLLTFNITLLFIIMDHLNITSEVKNC